MMGDHSGRGYSADGETPVHRVTLNGFSISTTTVTNAQFKEFVKATGYETTAERLGVSAVFYAAFEGTRSDILHTVQGLPWWLAVQGADWKHPHGPASTIYGKEDHPVVHVSWFDAVAYCDWTGARLPTEAEWERAAWAGNEGEEFAWGSELFPTSGLMANTWQGKFPYLNTGANGWRGTSPVGSFPANDFDLFDMIGNVWEWTSTLYSPSHAARPNPAAQAPTCGCSPESMRPDPEVSHVTKGGSHLCAPEYCRRYRPAARSPQTEDSATSHLGFRCARDAE